MNQSYHAVKTLGVMLCLLATAACWAQRPEDALTNAYRLIREKPAAVFHASGTETRGNAVHPIEIDAWTDIDAGLSRARLKVTSFYDGKFQYGWAGDGIQLFHYDPARNEYSAVIYGAYSGKAPDHMVDSVLQSTVALSKGTAILPIRLIRDIFAGDSGMYKSWMADATPTEVHNEDVHTVSYDTPRRKLFFTLDPKTGEFVSMEYWERKSSDPLLEVHWTLTLTTLDATPANWDFTFLPPQGCRPVALIHG